MIIHLIFLSILFICLIADIRTAQVPNKILLLLMVLASGYALFQSIYSPVIFFALLFPLSDLNKRLIHISIVGLLVLIAILFQPICWMIILSILGLWLLWEFGLMGGADIKIMVAALFFTASPVVLLPMFMIGGIQGLIALFQKKQEIPFVVSIFFGFLFYTFTTTM